jgi:hypothetical protein
VSQGTTPRVIDPGRFPRSRTTERWALGGFDWEGDIDGITVGPNAKLVLYEDENFTDKKRELAANARVPDLHKSIFSEGVESLRLTCTNPPASEG